MMTYTCYLIDDETSALEILQDYMALRPDLHLIQSFRNPVVAMDYILNHKAVDLIFIDIEMPEMDGISFAEKISHKAKHTIFVSAHQHYAYHAMERDSGYLLKPFSLTKFNQVVNKCIYPSVMPKVMKPAVLLIKKPGDRITKYKIAFDEILYMESQIRHTRIVTVQGHLISDQAFAKIKTLIQDDKRFIQVHRSFIVSVNFITAVGNNWILLQNHTYVPIGRRFRDCLSAVLQKN